MSQQISGTSDPRMLRSAMIGTAIGITYESIEIAMIIYILTLTSECGKAFRFPCALYLSGIVMNQMFLYKGMYTMYKTHTIQFRLSKRFLKLRQTSIVIYWISVIIFTSAVYRNPDCIYETTGPMVIALGVMACLVAALETLAEIYMAFKAARIDRRKKEVKLNLESMKIKYTGENITCTVCLGDVCNNSDAVQLNCSGKHIFHPNCIYEWFKQKTLCPICRQNVEVEREISH